MRPVSALARASCTPDNLTCLQDPALAVTNSIRTGVRHAMHPGMHCSCTHPHHYRPCVSVWEYKQRSACPQMALDMAGNLVPAAVISGAGYPQTALSTTYKYDITASTMTAQLLVTDAHLSTVIGSSIRGCGMLPLPHLGQQVL